MTIASPYFDRIEAELAAINGRVWDINVPLPLPRTQAKHGDIGNEWYVERNGDQWELIHFDDDRWAETMRETFDDDDGLMFRLVSMVIEPSASAELRVKIMGWVSEEWAAREGQK